MPPHFEEEARVESQASLRSDTSAEPAATSPGFQRNVPQESATFGPKRSVILPKQGLAELKKVLSEAAESGEEKPEAGSAPSRTAPSSGARAWCW